MGIHIDGSYRAPFRLVDSSEIALTIFIVLKFLLSIFVAGYWIKKRDSFTKVKLAIHVFAIIGGGIVWQMIQIVFLYIDETAISHWFHGYLASILMMGHFWLQMEIMKAFAVNSKVFTKKNLKRIALGLSIWWVITTGSYWAMIPYLGTVLPGWVSLWFNLGYPLFLFFTIFYDTFQCLYIMTSLYAMMKTKAELMNGNVGTKTCDTEDGKTQLTGFSRLWVLVILSVIIDWTAIIMATVSLQVSGIKNQTIINVIGSTIGFSHFDLVAFILDSVKRVKITRSNHIKSIETPKKSQTE